MSDHKFFKHLRDAHDRQLQLGKRLIKASQPEERIELRQKFYEAYFPHMIAEEASIFPLIKGHDDEDIKQDVLESLQEHHIGKIILREFMNLKVDSDVFTVKIKVLDELNRHHIYEEENKIYIHLKKLCSDKELDKIFKQYEEAEDKA